MSNVGDFIQDEDGEWYVVTGLALDGKLTAHRLDIPAELDELREHRRNAGQPTLEAEVADGLPAVRPSVLSVGFTGTRHGMTPWQLDSVRVILVQIAPPDAIFNAHHGDCVGADEQFHELCRHTNGRGYVIVHPGPLYDVARQAGCIGDERRAGRPHMARNHAIVAASTVMIATPAEATEQQRGGTWATIRMARRAGKPLAIVLPSGEVVKERWR